MIKLNIFFQDSRPNHSAPILTGSPMVDFNSGSSQLSVNWPTAVDVDTLQKNIKYEVNLSTSTVFNEAGWSNVGFATGTIFLVYPNNNYLIGARAIDDFGLTSEIISSSWSYPPEVVLLDQSQGDVLSNSWGAVAGCNYGSLSCYDSRSLQSIQFSNNVSLSRAGVKIFRSGGGHTANIRLALYPDSGGRPDYSSLLASAGVTDILDPAGEETIFTFNNPVNLSGNATYWLSLEVTTYSNGASGFHSNSFRNVLSFNDTISNGRAAFRPADFGELRFIDELNRDWFLKLYQ